MLLPVFSAFINENITALQIWTQEDNLRATTCLSCGDSTHNLIVYTFNPYIYIYMGLRTCVLRHLHYFHKFWIQEFLTKQAFFCIKGETFTLSSATKTQMPWMLCYLWSWFSWKLLKCLDNYHSSVLSSKRI